MEIDLDEINIEPFVNISRFNIIINGVSFRVNALKSGLSIRKITEEPVRLYNVGDNTIVIK